MTTSDDVPVDLLVVACPVCLGSAAAPPELAGRPVRCPLCAAGYVVPIPPAETSVPAGRTTHEAGGFVLPDAVAGDAIRPAGDPAIRLVVSAEEGLAQRSKLAARDRRRSRRNLVLAVVGSLILAVLVYLLGGR